MAAQQQGGFGKGRKACWLGALGVEVLGAAGRRGCPRLAQHALCTGAEHKNSRSSSGEGALVTPSTMAVSSNPGHSSGPGLEPAGWGLDRGVA